MSVELENTVAQSLMALGLYSSCFEVMALAFRAKTHEYLEANSASELAKFTRACKTAHSTFQYCGPKLVGLGAISQEEFAALDSLRKRRNAFAHEGYNQIFSLTIDEIEPDLKQMHSVTSKVDRWQVPYPSPREFPPVIQLRISPAFITGFVRQIARQVAVERLKTTPGVEP